MDNFGLTKSAIISRSFFILTFMLAFLLIPFFASIATGSQGEFELYKVLEPEYGRKRSNIIQESSGMAAQIDTAASPRKSSGRNKLFQEILSVGFSGATVLTRSNLGSSLHFQAKGNREFRITPVFNLNGTLSANVLLDGLLPANNAGIKIMIWAEIINDVTGETVKEAPIYSEKLFAKDWKEGVADLILDASPIDPPDAPDTKVLKIEDTVSDSFTVTLTPGKYTIYGVTAIQGIGITTGGLIDISADFSPKKEPFWGESNKVEENFQSIDLKKIKIETKGEIHEPDDTVAYGVKVIGGDGPIVSDPLFLQYGDYRVTIDTEKREDLLGTKIQLGENVPGGLDCITVQEPAYGHIWDSGQRLFGLVNGAGSYSFLLRTHMRDDCNIVTLETETITWNVDIYYPPGPPKNPELFEIRSKSENRIITGFSFGPDYKDFWDLHPDTKEIQIVYNRNGFPKHVGDGKTVYTMVLSPPITSNINPKYVKLPKWPGYFAIFAKDKFGNWNREVEEGNRFYLPLSEIADNTHIGHSVEVDLKDGVKLEFDEVTSAGCSYAYSTEPSSDTTSLPRMNTVTDIYYIKADKVSFSDDVRVKLSYNDSSVGQIDEKKLRIYEISAGKMKDITTDLDTQSNTVTGVTNSLSSYVVAVDLDNKAPITPTVSLKKGYNLFSPPGEPQETNPQKALGDDIDPLYMYRWNPVKGDYDGVSNIKLKAGESYWIYAWNDNTQIDLDISEPVNYSIDLSGKGWQMVGTPFSIKWGDVKVDGTKVRNDTSDSSYAGPLEPYGFTYDEEANGYLLAEPDGWSDLVLNGWEGYWIQTTESGVELGFDKGDSVSASASALKSDNQSILVDAASAGVALPPPPPMKPSQIEGLRAVVSPTLVRDSGGATFTVRSDRPVEGLQVEVLTANGKNVWNKNTNKSKLTWDAKGVPNGIYLYSVSAQVDGEFKQAGAGKLLLLK